MLFLKFDSALGSAETGLRGAKAIRAIVLTSGHLAHEGRRFAMAKVLRCGDLMPGCNAVIEGKDEAEVMAKGAEHAKTAHKMTAIPPDMAAKVKAAIKDKR